MSAETDLQAGDELLGYRVERLVGRGGMGIVYLAWDARLKRHVAVKVIAPELSSNARFRRRFLAESELAAALEHPSVVPVYDAGEVDGQLAIAMRYVRGTDLRRLLADEGPLAPRRALAVAAWIADALDAAHEHGLVHRDVKPSNILLDERERAYLADFGLSAQLDEQRVREGRSLGTAAYAAPEQIQGGPVDGRADVYALGCVLYECLTGETPFPRDRELAVLWAHLQDDPPRASERNASLPDAIDPVLVRALAKDPGERYASCGDLVEAAREALGLRDVVVVRRAPVLLALAGLALALVAVGAAFFLGRGGGASTPPRVAVGDDTLVRLDPATEEIAAVIPVGRGRKAVAVGGGTVWVYNVSEGTVSAIDAGTNEVRRVSRVATTPVESTFYNGPLLAADPDGAWVVGSRGGQGIVTRFRVASDAPVEHPLTSPAVGHPVAVAAGSGSVWLLVRNAGINAPASGVDQLVRIDRRTGRVVARVTFPHTQASGAALVYGLAVGEGAVWVANAETGELFRVDPGSSAVTGKVDLGPANAGSVPAAGRGSVWAVRDWGNKVVRVDPHTLAVTSSGTARGTLTGVALGAGAVWANGFSSGSVLRVDTRTGVASTVRLTADDTRAPASSAASASIAAGAGGVWVTISPAD